MSASVRFLTCLCAGVLCLLMGAGVSYATNTGPFCGFTVCEIAEPSICGVIGLWPAHFNRKTKAYESVICADIAGSFVGEHGPSCIFGRDCSIIGPGIAETAGLFIAQFCTCDYGLAPGCYLFDHGVLEGPMKLPACKAASALIYDGDSECWCMGGGNTEGSRNGP